MPYRPTSSAHAFDLLGLVPGAQPTEVKRAYRRLAMQWHPDRNAAPEAVERFRQVRAAYDFLLAAEAPDEADTDTDTGPARGADQHEAVWLDIDAAVFGTVHELEIGQPVPCDACEGEGRIHLARSRLCADCHGSGRLRTATGLDRCGICDGRGYVSVAVCEACDGNGVLHAARRVRVSVPPLSWPGRVLRLAGQATATDEQPPGDLLLTIRLQPHELFTVQGDDLHLEMPVSAFVLLAGGPLRVPVPGGEADLPLPPGRPEAGDRVLAGHGLPRRDGGRGDVHVRLTPVWPEALAEADAALLDTLAAHFATHAERTMPALAGWQARWLAPPRAGKKAKRAKAAKGKKGGGRR
ncbi:J domain-containing protein [Nitrogeniibacter mangrovi]|uniref:J domain-containing protein n=1 Tax=Nitrogeniibacter mangrovi TaxID=2016596 RepID=A0A6C1B6I5_9RHOO|nr:DnaJ C-terminal domain-containing protein [Nitrogeniibacter mangrovi]QID18649.1 J domain-containing protein [Nitrogeniibacter mangrovi]